MGAWINLVRDLVGTQNGQPTRPLSDQSDKRSRNHIPAIVAGPDGRAWRRPGHKTRRRDRSNDSRPNLMPIR
eukprot:2478551-Prymnesium_polylepis.1